MPISNTDQLSVYNGALRRLGSRKISSLTENREPRRVLDDIWGNGSAVKRALERGEWNFALRAVIGAYDPGITTGFGFRYAFAKPDDFCRLAALSASEYFQPPLTNDQYVDEAGYWLTDHETIYIRYVSSGETYGFDSSRWTEAFTEYLAAYLAHEGCERITNSDQKKLILEKEMAKHLTVAKAVDGMQEGVKFFPSGSWSSARGGSVRRERSRL